MIKENGVIKKLKMDEEIKKRFEEIERRLEKLELYLPKEKPKLEKSGDLETKIKKLCDDAEVNYEDFYKIFFIEDKEILLLIVPPGKNEAEKQLKATLLILTTSKYLFGQDFMKSSDINKKLEKLGIKSLVNLSTNLTRYRQFFIPRGKSKSRNFGFQIIIPGEKEGLKLIKDFLENEKK